MRCFVALGLKGGPGAALAGWLAKARQDFAELAVTPTENLHLTLAFLGSLDEPEVRAAGAAVRAAAAEARAFELRWTDGGAFPSRSRPRVLWLGADGGEPLRDTHRGLTAALATSDLPAADRTFRPHLTLARVRRGVISRQRHAEILGHLDALPAVAPSTAVSLVLYESRLGRGPAVHAPLVARQFGASTAVDP